MFKNLSKKFRRNLHLILPVSFFVFVLSAIVLGDVLAAGDIQTQFQVPFGDIQTGKVTTIAQYVNAVYKYLVGAGGVLAGIMFAIGGFMYITSSGDAGRVTQGKKYITNAILGLVLLVSSYVVLNTVNPNTTELKDIEVAKVAGNAMTGGNCKCDSDSDCPANKYCMGKNDIVPFNPEVNSDVAEGLMSFFNTSMAIATFSIGIGASLGPKVVMQGGVGAAGKATAKAFATKVAEKTAALAAKAGSTIKGGLLWTIKNPHKFVWKVTKGVAGVAATAWTAGKIVLFVGIVLLANSGFSLNIDPQCSNANGKSICIPEIFKYNLIPHGMGASDTNMMSLKVDMTTGDVEAVDGYRTFLYNSDGSLPQRSAMLGDVTGTYETYYFSPPLGNIEPVYFTLKTGLSGPISNIVDLAIYYGSKGASKITLGNIKEKKDLADVLDVEKGTTYLGITNRDACIPENNHCPCMEWETWDTENAIYKCKRQARCIKGTDLHPRLNKDYSYCLTGSKGEPCETDRDCRNGLQCVVAPSNITQKFSLFYNGVFDLKQKSSPSGFLKDLTDDTGAIKDLKAPFAMQQMCMDKLTDIVGKDEKMELGTLCTPSYMNIANASYIKDFCKPGTGVHKIDCVLIETNLAQAASDAKEKDTKEQAANLSCKEYLWDCSKYMNSNSEMLIWKQESSNSLQQVDRKSFYVYTAKTANVCYEYYSKHADEVTNKIKSRIKELLKIVGGREMLFLKYNETQKYVVFDKSGLENMYKNVRLELETYSAINGTDIKANVLNKVNYSLLSEQDCVLSIPFVYDYSTMIDGNFKTVTVNQPIQINLTKMMATGTFKDSLDQFYGANHENYCTRKVPNDIGGYDTKVEGGPNDVDLLFLSSQ